MCTGQSPSTVGAALAAVRSGLAFLNQAAVAELPGAVQADCLPAPTQPSRLSAGHYPA